VAGFLAEKDCFEEGFDEGLAFVVEAGGGLELEPQVVVGTALCLVEDKRISAH
jgi:hypothetical protein